MPVSFRLALLGVAAAVIAFTLAASAAASGGFTVTPLVSDNGVPNTTHDGNLVNSWGLTAGATGPWWVADNGKGVSTLYTGDGSRLGLVVTVGDAPTGVVANSTTGFNLRGGNTQASVFVFDTEQGVIRAWNGSLGTTAEVEIPSEDGAVFKGLAIAQTAAGPRLYATDFHNRRVDVFDGNWQQVNRPFQFFDPTIPSNYGPLGIQAIGNHVFVTYAKTQPGSDDEAHGSGLGFVDSFNAATGILDGKVAVRGTLNAPFGLAMAPPGFGSVGGDLLVGNFGDGQIHAYKPLLGGLVYRPDGELDNSSGSPISIDDLWSLHFGNGSTAGPTDTLFFTSGPNDEGDGLFGSVTSG